MSHPGADVQTITETERRLRVAGRLARRQCSAASNARVEVGYRDKPQHLLSAPTTYDEAQAACYPEGDDLEDYGTVEGAARTDYIRQGGAVVHLYVSTTGGWGELIDVVVVWLGLGDEEPRIIDTRFARYSG